MNTDLKTNMKQLRTLEKVILIILLIPILWVVFYFVSRPIIDNIDHDKFKTLDNQMQILYNEVKTAANDQDDWKYMKECESQLDGDWPTGKYYCTTTISIDKTISSLSELNYFHDKYFPIIDNSNIWDKQKSTAFKATGDFGKQFVVSGGSKNYTETKTGIWCQYYIDLSQIDGNESDYTEPNNTAQGSELKNKEGNFFINLQCQEKANQSWYTPSDYDQFEGPYNE